MTTNEFHYEYNEGLVDGDLQFFVWKYELPHAHVEITIANPGLTEEAGELFLETKVDMNIEYNNDSGISEEVEEHLVARVEHNGFIQAPRYPLFQNDFKVAGLREKVERNVLNAMQRHFGVEIARFTARKMVPSAQGKLNDLLNELLDLRENNPHLFA